MAIRTLGPATRLSARPYTAADEQAVLALVNADRLAGQPPTTREMLAAALAGRSRLDAAWWAQLDPPHTEVVTDAAGEVLGAVSWARRPLDGAGLILWLHCFHQDQLLAEALLSHALEHLGPRPVHAFAAASALTLGLKGLPLRHRPTIRKALEASGFTGRDAYRYLRRTLRTADAEGVLTYPVAEVSERADPPGWDLRLREPDGTRVAEASVCRPLAGVGMLRWLSTDPARRGRGLGHGLLAQCFKVLAEHQASEVIAYLDEPSPQDAGDTAAHRLCASTGFSEVDVCRSFTRTL